jgi:hypothetical protein
LDVIPQRPVLVIPQRLFLSSEAPFSSLRSAFLSFRTAFFVIQHRLSCHSVAQRRNLLFNGVAASLLLHHEMFVTTKQRRVRCQPMEVK